MRSHTCPKRFLHFRSCFQSPLQPASRSPLPPPTPIPNWAVECRPFLPVIAGIQQTLSQFRVGELPHRFHPTVLRFSRWREPEIGAAPDLAPAPVPAEEAPFRRLERRARAGTSRAARSGPGPQRGVGGCGVQLRAPALASAGAIFRGAAPPLPPGPRAPWLGLAASSRPPPPPRRLVRSTPAGRALSMSAAAPRPRRRRGQRGAASG